MSDNVWKVIMWGCPIINVIGAIGGSVISLFLVIPMAYMLWSIR